MKKPILHVMMEVKARELESRMLLALEAAVGGMRVYYGPASQLVEGVRAGVLPVGGFFDKSISKAKYERLSARVNLGCFLFSQDEESGLLDESYEEFLSVRSSSETVGLSTALFCWGQHDFEAWVRRYPEASYKIYPSGSPRVDLWRREFQPFYQDDIDKHRAEFGNFILLASNFGYGNGIQSVDSMVEQLWRVGFLKSEADENAYRQRCIEDFSMFLEFVKLVRYLSDKYPALNIVIRPHPVESHERWLRELDGLSNVHVIFRGGIGSWVRAARVVIHNGCTTALESRVSGVLPIAFIPFESARNCVIPNDVSHKCFSYDEVSAVLESVLGEGFISPSIMQTTGQDIILRRLGDVTGDLAVNKIVTVIRSSGLPMAFPLKKNIKYFNLFAEYFLRSCVGSYRRLRGRSTKSEHKFPGLSGSEVIALKERFEFVNPEYKHCSVVRVYGDVYCIESK